MGKKHSYVVEFPIKSTFLKDGSVRGGSRKICQEEILYRLVRNGLTAKKEVTVDGKRVYAIVPVAVKSVEFKDPVRIEQGVEIGYMVEFVSSVAEEDYKNFATAEEVPVAKVPVPEAPSGSIEGAVPLAEVK